MNKFIKLSVVGAAAMVLVGCTMTGSSFTNGETIQPQQTSTFTNGSTTTHEVVAAIGRPNVVKRDVDGTEIWTYQRTNMEFRGSAWSFVVYHTAKGKGSSKITTIVLTFKI